MWFYHFFMHLITSQLVQQRYVILLIVYVCKLGKHCDINDQLQIEMSAPREQTPGTRFNHARNNVVLIHCCNRLMKSQSQPLYQSIKCYKGNIVNINGARTFIKQDLLPSRFCSSECLCLWRKCVGSQILEGVL